LRCLPSAKNAPYIISVAFVRNPLGGEDSIISDCDEIELQCVDQIIHLSVDSKMRIYALEQSRGSFSPGFMNIKYLKADNLQQIVKPKVQELDTAVSRMIDL